MFSLAIQQSTNQCINISSRQPSRGIQFSVHWKQARCLYQLTPPLWAKKKKESLEARMEKLSSSGLIKRADAMEGINKAHPTHQDLNLSKEPVDTNTYERDGEPEVTIADTYFSISNSYRPYYDVEEVDFDGNPIIEENAIYNEEEIASVNVGIHEYDMSIDREKSSTKLMKFLKQHTLTTSPLTENQREIWKAKFPWDKRVKEVNKQLFGNDDLRGFQREAINLINLNQNVLLSIPTGGGKSLCYQIPASLEKGTTIVVSPLISLIEDQVHFLRQKGISCIGLSSQVPVIELKGIYSEMQDDYPHYKIIFITPERVIQSSKFMNALKAMYRKGNLQRFVIDEAHCISEWGHDFRKDYRRLSVFKEEFPDIPILAMSASCTPSVRSDILKELTIDKSTFVLQDSYNRKNLWIQVERKSNDSYQDIYQYIFNSGYKTSCGIVFALTCADTERIAEYLSSRGLNASFYHGNLPPQERRTRHIAWLKGDIHIMCTTIAFGLGINKEDVRFVVHSTIPTSIEAYYQQIGRAGRDGEESDCIMFYSRGDRPRIEKIIRINAVSLFNNGFGDITSCTEEEAASLKEKIDSLEDAVDYEVSAMKIEKLDDISFFCEEKKVCRKKLLLEHFGEDAPSYCGSCDVCVPKIKRKVSTLKKKGKTLKSSEIQDILDRLTKSMKSKKNLVREEDPIDLAVEENDDPPVQGSLQEKIALISKQKEERKRLKELKKNSFNFGSKSSATPVMQSSSVESDITDNDEIRPNGQHSKILYQLCDDIASEKNISARNVLTHQNIKDIAAKQPKSLKELQKIRGIGIKKAANYGERIISIFVDGASP